MAIMTADTKALASCRGPNPKSRQLEGDRAAVARGTYLRHETCQVSAVLPRRGNTRTLRPLSLSLALPLPCPEPGAPRGGQRHRDKKHGRGNYENVPRTKQPCGRAQATAPRLPPPREKPKKAPGPPHSENGKNEKNQKAGGTRVRGGARGPARTERAPTSINNASLKPGEAHIED